MFKICVSVLREITILAVFRCFYASQTTIRDMKVSSEQDTAFIGNSDTVHYFKVSQIWCILQCFSAATCCGINYQKTSLQCSLKLSSYCSTASVEGYIFMRIPSTVPGPPGCSDCIYFGSSSYKPITVSGTANWESSRDSCINLGGKLAEIETEEENTFLKSTLNRGFNYWIGGYDFDGNGKFAWNSKPSEVLTFTDWGAFWEPDNLFFDHCLILWDFYSLRWGSWNCNSVQSFICEFV